MHLTKAKFKDRGRCKERESGSFLEKDSRAGEKRKEINE